MKKRAARKKTGRTRRPQRENAGGQSSMTRDPTRCGAGSHPCEKTGYIHVHDPLAVGAEELLSLYYWRP